MGRRDGEFLGASRGRVKAMKGVFSAHGKSDLMVSLGGDGQCLLSPARLSDSTVASFELYGPGNIIIYLPKNLAAVRPQTHPVRAYLWLFPDQRAAIRHRVIIQISD